MPDTAEARYFHFWTDVETTGFDVGFDTILEISWLLTDDKFAMVSPLRQRFTNLTPPTSHRNHEARSLPVSPHDAECWSFGDDCWDHIKPVVQNMHNESGLREAWEATSKLALLTKPQDVIRLIMDDLAAIGFQVHTDKLILSGAGVSHFENRLLPLHFPDLFGEGVQPALWAYWQCDTSNAMRLLDTRTRDKLRREGLDHSDSPWQVIQVENNVDDSVEHLVAETNVGTVFTPGTIVKHRAADDVVSSLLDARMLRLSFDLL